MKLKLPYKSCRNGYELDRKNNKAGSTVKPVTPTKAAKPNANKTKLHPPPPPLPRPPPPMARLRTQTDNITLHFIPYRSASANTFDDVNKGIMMKAQIDHLHAPPATRYSSVSSS